MDTDVPVTIWLFESTGDKTYRIRTADEHYLNTNDEGLLDDFGFNEDWMLVTREERLADLATATKDNPKDATWLIGGHDFANQDERFDQWDVTSRVATASSQGGDGIVHANRALECWNSDHFSPVARPSLACPTAPTSSSCRASIVTDLSRRSATSRDAGERSSVPPTLPTT